MLEPILIKVYHLHLHPPHPIYKHRVDSKFTILPMSIAEVMTRIVQLDDSKAPGTYKYSHHNPKEFGTLWSA